MSGGSALKRCASKTVSVEVVRLEARLVLQEVVLVVEDSAEVVVALEDLVEAVVSEGEAVGRAIVSTLISHTERFTTT